MNKYLYVYTVQVIYLSIYINIMYVCMANVIVLDSLCMYMNKYG